MNFMKRQNKSVHKTYIKLEYQMVIFTKNDL